MTRASADAAVIGAGVVGLCTALALADAGLDVLIVGDARAGEASPAAGGILDAGHGFPSPGTRNLARAARDMWPAFTNVLAARTGVSVPLNRDGVLELAPTIYDAERLRAMHSADASWLDDRALTALEPQLSHHLGALHHHLDGAVNPLVLLKALKHAVGHHARIRVVQLTVAAISVSRSNTAAEIRLTDNTTYSARHVVVAAGAWSGSLAGVPMHLPVSPLRGQLMSVASKALRHVVMLGAGYAVPRGDGRTIIGGTEEHVGFDAAHTAEGVQRIRTLATAILPSLGNAGMLSTWAGLRPMTRDGLPIIGADVEQPSVLYACGHGKNGILLAPMTGALIAALVTGTAPPIDPTPLSPSRFSAPTEHNQHS